MSILVIRNEQMRVFNAYARSKFDDWLVNHVCTRWAGWPLCSDRVALNRFLDDAVAQAQQAGMTASSEIVAYVDLVMLLGQAWRTDTRIPWVEQVFQSDQLSAQQKLQVLTQLVRTYGLENVGPEWSENA